MSEKIEYDWQCPKCGRWADENSLEKRTKPEYNYQMGLQFGGYPVDWEETHICTSCETKFLFMNSNC